MLKTNETPSHPETIEAALIKAVENAIKTGVDVETIVKKIRTDLQRPVQTKIPEGPVIPYPEEMEWQGPVGVE